MHLYGGDPPGTGTTGVYLPSGYTALYANPQTLPEYRGGSFAAFYSILNITFQSLPHTSLVLPFQAQTGMRPAPST